jgi:stage II sporulation protein E
MKDETAEYSAEYNYNKGKIEKIWQVLSEIITKRNILLYLITFLLSMVQCGESTSVFSIAFCSAICANGIPVFIIYLISAVGTFIKFGSTATLIFILKSLLFIALVLIFKPWYEEEYKNERRKLGRYVFISTFIVQFIYMLFNQVLIYDILLNISISITTYIFYKIFSESIVVISEIGEKNIFSIEEIIGAILIVSISLLSISNLQILGLNIGQVLMIIMILILGWKNGVMVGSIAGITVGTVIAIIGNTDPILIASFALSGMFAGILNRFGRIGVVVGFILGNTLLTYVYSGNTTTIIYFKEIIISSLTLILVPKNLKINIVDLFDKSIALPEGPTYRLRDGFDTAQKLNNMSTAINQISSKYIKTNESTQKQIFLDEADKELDKIKNNILYDEICNFDNGIIEDIYEILNKNEKISQFDLQDIFKNHNSYIVTLNSSEDINEIEKSTQEVVKILSNVYKTSKSNFLLNKKIDENKKVISSQLRNVSEAISNIADDINDKKKYINESAKIKLIAKNREIKIDDISINKNNEQFIIELYTSKCNDECYINKIEELLSDILEDDIVLLKKECALKNNNNVCKQLYISKNNYDIRLGIAKKTKDKSLVSGDSYIKTQLDDGKILLALSDGMGSGSKARKSSQVAINMLSNLLKNGFDRDTSIKLINNTMCLNSNDDMYSTLDIAIFDLYSGNMEIVKNGSCPTFLKSKNRVQLVKSMSLPAGILDNIELVSYDIDLENEDIIVMCTDGIIDSNNELTNKELWIRDLLEKIETTDPKKIADIILQEAIDNNVGKIKDDMTVIVGKILKK